MSEVLDNLVKQDSEFSESKFKSKVENEFIQIMLSMVSRKTLPVRHFVNDEVYAKGYKSFKLIANNNFKK